MIYVETEENLNLQMVSRHGLMGINTPFFIRWEQVEKWNLECCTFCAIRVAAVVALECHSWIKVGLDVNWTGGSGCLISSKMEHWNSLWCK